MTVTAPALAAPSHAETPARARVAPVAGAGAAVVRREPASDPLAARSAGQCACGGGCPSCLADAGIQPKLLVGALDDPAEREADRVADAIVGGGPGPDVGAAPAATVQRCGDIPSVECSCHGGGDDHDTIARAPAAGVGHGHGLAHGGPAPPAVADVVGGGAGQTLEPGVRSTMESRFGTGFGHVRVHTDDRAAQSAAAIGARAYTLGSDVVFGAGQYAPGTTAGMHTLAHELAHVVQQGSAAHGPKAIRRQGDPRHNRGYAGEQGMGFILYRQEDGWIFFEGPSGSAGHGVTTSGFDGVAYNTKTGETHLLDNKSLGRAGNVGSATAIDPSRNLAQNLDPLIARVEAAKDVPGRIRLLARLRALRASLASGQPLPQDVKLVVTSVGGRSTGVTPRLQSEGVEYRPVPNSAPAQAPASPAAPTSPTAAPATNPTTAPKPALTPTPSPPPETVAAPAPAPASPEVIPVPGGKIPLETAPKPVVEPTPPVVTPAVRPSPWKTGLKAGGKAVITMLVFAGLEYWVHKKAAEELEKSLEMAREGSMPWAQRLKRQDPTKPVYVRWTIESQEYSQFYPFLGWMPEPPVLHMTSMAMVREPIDPPTVEEHDTRMLNPWHPGITTIVTYTEVMVE